MSSMLSNLLKPSLRSPVPSLRRHATSAASKSATKGHLTPQKMRALISLYHQADDFITPETLSNAIDKAFIDDRQIWASMYGGRREKTVRDLQWELKQRRLLPELSPDDIQGQRKRDDEGFNDYEESGGLWSSYAPERVRRLKAALYGTEASDAPVPKPGWEVLEEEHERVQKQLKE